MGWDGKEKRRFVRACFPCKIIITKPEEQVIKTHTEDIGAGGVRVVIEKRLDISCLVGLEIYFGLESVKCEGRVVWVLDKRDPVSDASVMFDTGIEFYNISEDDRKVIDNFVNAVISAQE
jgi:c-di-GMP-binding flagellar brake protein YcgR